VSTDFRRPGDPSRFISDIPPPPAASFTPPLRASYPVGGVVWYAGFALELHEAGWLECAGQEELVADFPELAARLEGLSWDPPASDADHFRLPNLRGRMFIVADLGVEFLLGQSGGASTHTLSVDELPAHTHGLPAARSAAVAEANPGARFGEMKYTNDTPATSGSSTGTGSAGAGEAHNNMPPFVVMRAYIRALP